VLFVGAKVAPLEPDAQERLRHPRIARMAALLYVWSKEALKGLL
jgi:hypothetical protein